LIYSDDLEYKSDVKTPIVMDGLTNENYIPVLITCLELLAMLSK